MTHPNTPSKGPALIGRRVKITGDVLYVPDATGHTGTIIKFEARRTRETSRLGPYLIRIDEREEVLTWPEDFTLLD